jgi:hypothetical protein
LFDRDHVGLINEAVSINTIAGVSEYFQCEAFPKSTAPPPSWRSPWMDGFLQKPAPFAVPSIAGGAGKCPKGRGDGSPRLRSSTWTYCLSNPTPPRSTGDFDSQDANQNTAFGA